MVFDSDVPVNIDESGAERLLLANIERFLVSGVIDPEEFLVTYTQPGQEPLHQPDVGQLWKQVFLAEPGLDGDIREPWQVSIRDQPRHVWLLWQRNGFDCPVFRRGAMSKGALVQRLKGWIVESVELCKRNLSLSLPQMFYTIRDRRYVGTLQLLFPFYCGQPKACLALALEYGRDEAGKPCYEARTVLTLRMARGSARLLTTPQVCWMRGE